MELHHKLRRDPNWHPSACNICGQLGHQAANCTNGTINWKQIYGEDAFRLKTPFYPSDYDRMAKERIIDFTDLEKRARDFAKKKATAVGDDYEKIALPEGIQGLPDTPAVPLPTPSAPKPVELPMPEHWATAKDTAGRTYYWHRQTKQVQWDRPVADVKPADMQS